MKTELKAVFSRFFSTSLFKSLDSFVKWVQSMFIKGIKRNYLKVLEDDSIADAEKIDALLLSLGAAYLVSKDDRVYVFQKDELTVRFDAKHARAYHFKDYVVKDMNKLFHGF